MKWLQRVILYKWTVDVKKITDETEQYCKYTKALTLALSIYRYALGPKSILKYKRWHISIGRNWKQVRLVNRATQYLLQMGSLNWMNDHRFSKLSVHQLQKSLFPVSMNYIHRFKYSNFMYSVPFIWKLKKILSKTEKKVGDNSNWTIFSINLRL